MVIDEATGAKNIPVQKISQKDFDAMSTTKREFFLELIKKGQVEIYAEEEKRPEKERRSPFSIFYNKKIKLTLNTGETIEGKLTDVWLYEIALELPDKNSLLVFKHAIATVTLSDT